MLCLLILCVTGCGSSPTPTSLDANAARAALTQFLETWQRGGNPADLRSLVPSIIVGDPEWEAGGVLKSFAVLKDKERQDGVNVHATVRLSVQRPRGRATQSEVTYIVGTSPVLTIHRQ